MDFLSRTLSELITSSVARAREALEHIARAPLTGRMSVIELQEEIRRLQRANAELIELDRLKDEFIGNMTHELKTPLVTIRGYADMLRAERLGPLTEAQQQAVAVLRKSAKALQRQVDRLLAASRNREYASPLSSQPFSLQGLLQDVAERHGPSATAKGIDLVFDTPGGDFTLFGDRRRLREVLDNLVSNAIKFTDRGGRVEVRAKSPTEGRLPMEVADSGCGIDKHALEHIFERFRQADGMVRRRYGGSGLGLAIVQANLRLHGGSIRVESEKGAGARFFFDVPLAPG